MLKKILLIVFSIILIAAIAAALLSRFYGVGIRASNGSYLGYAHATKEWLFLQYPNIPVRMDGPYVFSTEGNRYSIIVQGDDTNPPNIKKIAIDHEVKVRVDNEEKTHFNVPIRNNYPRSELAILAPEKLLAISDLEGEFDATVNLLQGNKVIDGSLNWAYGDGHLVLIGDMVDRGKNVVPLLWLIYKLEGQAQLAGGNVHYVLGNHERYMLDGRTKSIAKKYYGSFRATGMSQSELWSEKSELGRWLRSKPVALKIGGTLFVHGGVSADVLIDSPTLETIDIESKENFVIGDSIRRNVSNSVIHGSNGILFYRGLSKDMSEHGLGQKADMAHVDQVLKTFKVDRIAIGHSLVNHIGYDYEGKVIRVDVPHSSGTSEALLIEDEELWRVDNKGEKFSLEPAENYSGD